MDQRCLYCGMPTEGTRWCSRNCGKYGRRRLAREAERAREPATAECRGCGAEIPCRGSRGGLRLWCSDGCRLRVARAEGRAKPPTYYPRSPIYQATCQVCGALFCRKGTASRPSMSCSRPCARAWYAELGRRRYLSNTEDILARQREARAARTPERREQYAETRRRWIAANPELRRELARSGSSRRRAQKLATQVERFTHCEVFERDGWSCGICSDAVDPDLAWPDPQSPSLDHVMPLSLGGMHTLDNVRLAHLECNVRRGNRIDEEQAS